MTRGENGKQEKSAMCPSEALNCPVESEWHIGNGTVGKMFGCNKIVKG